MRPIRDDVLVEPQWLEEHLHDPELRLVEVDVSPAAYDEGHIDGAVLWNIYRDLKDSNYQLVDKAAIESLVARSGIDRDSTVVFYGYGPAMGFWVMKLYGHADVRILDCSRGAWQSEGRPWTKEVATPPATSYGLPDEDKRVRANQRRVQAAIDDPSCTILDVRTDLEYRGERFWPSGGLEEGGRAGHVPSAELVPIEGLQDERGSFRSETELREIFASVNRDSDDEMISYCTIGGRASTAWFVLTYLLGRQSVRVYDGSWAEWGRMPTTPVAARLGTIRRNQSELLSDGRGPGAALHAQLGEDARHVHASGLRADEENASDLLVREAGSHEPEHLHLAGGEAELLRVGGTPVARRPDLPLSSPDVRIRARGRKHAKQV